jgi:quinol monooxygenase YgiN
MAVIVTAEVAGQTEQGYDGMRAALAEPMRRAPGFILHCARPVEGGWRVVEVWESKEAADRWFATGVAPHLPPGIHPKRHTEELHSLVLP